HASRLPEARGRSIPVQRPACCAGAVRLGQLQPTGTMDRRKPEERSSCRGIGGPGTHESQELRAALCQNPGPHPAKAVEAVRVDAARRQLEETTDRIATIAEACGFGEEEQMRTAFIRVLGVPPREYRKHFAST